MRKTYTITEFFGKNNFIVSNCFSISFTRPLGSNPVYVNGLPIADGQTFSVNQNVGDIDTSSYEIVFGSGAGDNELYVVRIVPEDMPQL
jgi:hypothetical protein